MESEVAAGAMAGSLDWSASGATAAVVEEMVGPTTPSTLLSPASLLKAWSFGGVALVVHGLELDLLAVDAALGVDLIHSQLEAGDLGLAVCGGGAGVGGDGAQRDGIAVGRATVGAAGIVHAAAGAGSEGHRHCACRDQGDALGGELRVHSVLPLFLKTLHIPFNAHLGKIMFISTPVRGTTATTHDGRPFSLCAFRLFFYSLTDGGLHKKCSYSETQLLVISPSAWRKKNISYCAGCFSAVR